MAFPSSPTSGQEYTQDGRTWKWDGVAWEILALAGPAGPPGVISATAPLNLTSGVLTINLSNYLPVSGGVLDVNATIDASTATVATTFSGDAFGVQLSANPSENSSLQYGGLQVQNFSGTMSVTPTGLTFPNSSTQTVAYPGSTGFLLKADNLSGLANTGTARTNLGLGTMAVETATNYPQLGTANTFTETNTFTSPTLTFGNTSATSSINIGTGATVSGSVRTINIGNQSAAGSNNNINIGGGSGTTAVLISGPTTVSNNFTATGLSVNLGTQTATANYNFGNGALVSGATRTMAIGTNALAGSTNTITIGSAAGTSTTTLQGTTNGITAAADTNSVALATTAFVVGQAGSATPLVDGTAAVGTSLRYARQDHVHGTDTTRAAVDSQVFTGTPTLPTGTIATTQSPGDNTTALATTAFVTAAVPAFATTAQVVAATSTTTALAPALAPSFLTHPECRPLAYFKQTAVSGSGGVTASTVDYGAREMFLSSLAVGRAGWMYGITGANIPNMSRADWRKVDFSKKIWLSGRAMPYSTTAFGSSYPGDANTFARITLGGYSTNTTGDMTLLGIGWKKQGGLASFYTLTVHNGTTRTDVATSVSATDNSVIDWVLYSEGNGNVSFYINGTLAASTSAGPTGITAAYAGMYREQVEAATTPTARQILETTGGWLYMEA